MVVVRLSTVQLAAERAFIKRSIQCRLVIDHVTAKSISKWLNEHLAQYEQVYGKIPSPEERVISP